MDANNRQFPDRLPPFDIVQLNAPHRIRVFIGIPPAEWPLEELKSAVEAIAKFEAAYDQPVPNNGIDLALFSFARGGGISTALAFPLTEAGQRMTVDTQEHKDTMQNIIQVAINANSVICVYTYLAAARVFCRLCIDGNHNPPAS